MSWRCSLTALAPATHIQRRTFLFARKAKEDSKRSQDPPPILQRDDLFHALSTSPIPSMREKASRIKALATCPISSKPVAFDCPECGYPTHASQADWEQDVNKSKYWPKLREANEDEHDLRSGRRMHEFELPGPQPYEEAISMGNWDLFFYTRGFASIDDDRSRRHVSKLLSYPVTIGGVLHEHSPYSTRNQRLTYEGLRSLTALRQSIHPPLGTNLALQLDRPTNPIRIFIVGARAESSLPQHVWEQLVHLFRNDVTFQIFFIGPEVHLQLSSGRSGPNRGYDNKHHGVPAYTLPVSPNLTLHSIQAAYREVHATLGPFDPYNDVFFAFSPGFGFPTVPTQEQPQPNSIQLATNWNEDVKMILDSKCALFCGGFSPTDVERDIAALQEVEGITGEFDWILTPGENVFASQKWEIAEFDPRVSVKTNYALWGIRGKRYEVDEPRFFSRRERLQ